MQQCVKEANSTKNNKKPVIDDKLFQGYFGTNSHRGTLKLKSISNVKGINGLNPRIPLELLSDNLTIIYGRNGSGKSGYSRILKSACGARKTDKLLCDVFKGIEAQECDFEIIKDGIYETINWKPEDKILNNLSSIDVFDSSTGISYVLDENQVTYEPPLLKFISYLIDISGDVNSLIYTELLSCNNEIPKVPNELNETVISKQIAQIKTLNEFTAFQKKIKWNKKKQLELSALESELLVSKNTDYTTLLTNQISVREKIINKIIENDDKLKPSVFTNINKLNKKIAANKSDIIKSEKILKGQKINGISTTLFKKFWDCAKEFSENEVYPDEVFPFTKKDVSKCVFCQQDITDEAKMTLTSLDAFIKNKFNSELETNTKDLDSILKNLPDFWNDEMLNQMLSSSFLDGKKKSRVKKIFKGQLNRSNSFSTAKKIADLIKTNDVKLVNELKADLKKLRLRHQQAVSAKSEIGIRKITDSINELKIEKWFSENISNFKNGIVDNEYKTKLNAAKSLCNTTSYSTKKSDLATDLISKVFIKRFEDELKELGANSLKVTITKNKTSKGIVNYSIKLKGNKINEKIEHVLSEGEFRIVSLAAFLADVAEKPFNSPFIFDDPISSLDADFEEECVKRLIKLSKERQVIVFTHRLSLLTLLNDLAKKESIKPTNVTLISEPWGKGQPSINDSDTTNIDSALNILKNDKLPKAKKILISEGTEEYYYRIKSITSEFRILIEKSVEDILLSKTVLRFRRSIMTGSLVSLIKINESDVKFIDGLMTKYSIPEHSQSFEIPNKAIDSEVLESDITAMSVWIKEFKARK